MTSPAEYELYELKQERKFLDSRQKLGLWRQEDCPSVEGSIDRISWLLNGSYGMGAMLMAKQIISNRTYGKSGKNLDKAWLAVGKELIMLIALHDSTEYNARKITDSWKKQCVNFEDVNARAVREIKEFLENQED